MAFSRKARSHWAKKRANKKDETDEPFYVGDNARHAGKLITENPYLKGSKEFSDWIEGFLEAILK